MKVSMMAGALGAAALLALAACESKVNEVPGPDETETAQPAADERFTYAAIYECADGRELQIVMRPDGVLARIGGADAVTLSMPAESINPEWSDGTHSFTDMGGQATWQEAGGEPIACNGASRPLPPPAAAGVVRDLTSADAGATVELKVGDKFSISLSDVPTAGYAWAPANPPAFLTKTEELGGATTTAQFLPGYAGGNHWIVLVFEATATGEGELELVQKRPWEDTPSPDDNRFKVMVSVK
jgi:predicted secreted protein